MSLFRVFLLLLFLLAAPNTFAQQTRVSIGGFAFEPPEGSQLVRETADTLVFERYYFSEGRRFRIHWLFTCVPNVRRTSQISELQDRARDNGESLRDYSTGALGAIDYAIYWRTRVFEGQKLTTLDAYFATRDLEYRFSALPATETPLSVEDQAALPVELMRIQMQRILEEGQFILPPETTITEDDYRTRLYLALGLLAALVLSGSVYVFRRVRRRR